MLWFWLSYVDTEQDQFNGGVIVQAHTGIEAVKVAQILGCSPGGQVLMMDIGRDLVTPEMDGVFERWRDRLLTREQAEQVDAELEEEAPTL